MKRFFMVLTGIALLLIFNQSVAFAGNDKPPKEDRPGIGNSGNTGNNGNNGNNGNHGGNNGDNSEDSGEESGDCDFSEDIILADLEGTLVEFLGNPNNSNATTKFLFETVEGTYLVKLAPAWYLNLQEVVLELDDELVITGFTCEEDDEDYTSLVAMWVVKGEQQLDLRTETGHPLWSAYGHFSGCSNNISKYPVFDYDMVNEEATPLTGEVIDVKVDCLDNGDYPGYLLTLKLDDESDVTVVLAPYWYLSNQFFQMEEGAQVSVTGMFYVLEDESVVFLARFIETEDSFIVLRDSDGLPFWQSVRLK